MGPELEDKEGKTGGLIASWPLRWQALEGLQQECGLVEVAGTET